MKNLLLVVLLWLTVCGAAQAQDNDDVQFWPDVTVGFRLKPRVVWSLFGTLRPGHDQGRVVSEQLGTAVNLQVNKYLSITPAYRHVWSQPDVARHSQEDRYFADVTPRLPLGKGFSLSDRNRGEIRDINNRVSWRYRNRVQLDKALQWHDHRFTAYLSSEIYYDSRFAIWNRKQFWAGTRLPVTKHLTLDLHYSRNLDKRSRPGRLHIIGMFSRWEF